MTEPVNLLPGEESVVFANAGYTSASQHEELQDLAVTWHIAAKRRQIKALPEGPHQEVLQRIAHLMSQVRSRVEPVFHLIKNRCHHRKLRYQGLKNNGAQHHVLCALANRVIAKKVLLAA